MKDLEPRYFTLKEYVKVLYDATYMMTKYKQYLKLIDSKFNSNIMLAVTYVNGCKICSYYHTKELLKSGASDEELKSMLDGSFKDLKKEDTKALLFAEHYADAKGDYDKESFSKLIDEYGKDMAYGIMATIKLIMFGNISGISLGNMKERFKFKKPQNSKPLTDLSILLSTIILMPLFIIISLFRKRKEFPY